MAKSSLSLTGTLAAAVWLLIAALLITGIALSTRYMPNVVSAHDSAERIRESAIFGAIHSFHYLGSGLLLLLSGVNILILLWTNRFSRSDKWLWWTTVGAFVFALISQMSGNLLPFSQHDVRTAYIEAGIGSQAPFVGGLIRDLTLGSDTVSQATLDRWYLVHRLVVPIIFLLLAYPAIRAIRHETRTRTEWWLALIPVACLLAFAGFVQSPHGQAATEIDLSSGATKPMWYVLPMHAMLNAFNSMNPNLGWIGSILVPKVITVILILFPFIFRNPNSIAMKVTGKSFAIILVAGTSIGFLNYGSNVQPPLSPELAFEQPIPPADDANATINEILAASGKDLFKEHNCVACHSIGDEKAGTFGPNLAGVGSKHPSADWFVELLKDPESKGITTMPAFDTIPDDDLHALAEYLRSLR